MKKIITTLAFFAVTFAAINAQNFTQGSKQLNLTLGLPSSSDGVKIPPIGANLEYCVADYDNYGSVGVGGILGYMAVGESEYTISEYMLGATATYHYTIPSAPKVELYTGLCFYYGITKGDSNNRIFDSFVSDSGFDYYYCIGGKYFFNDKLGAVLQLGGMTTLNVGISLKL